ncbi:MAG TPA: hypothetical protein VIG93_02535, partial [Gaiellaceae bacterium]
TESGGAPPAARRAPTRRTTARCAVERSEPTRKRDDAQLALGDATFREDETATASLGMQDLESAIAEREDQRAAALGQARDRVEDERLEVRRTEVLPPDGDDE